MCTRLRVWGNTCAQEGSARGVSGCLAFPPLVGVTGARVWQLLPRAVGTTRTAEDCSSKAQNILPWILGCNHSTEVSPSRSLCNPKSARSQPVSASCSWLPTMGLRV